MYDTSDIRKGLKVKINNDPYIIVDFAFTKPGKGQAFTKTKIKNLKTGLVVEKTFKSSEKLEPVNFEEKTAEYLYNDGTDYYLMDSETYEQFAIPGHLFGDGIKWLKENCTVKIQYFEDNPINVELPNFVEIKVEKADPAVKGDTATNANKPVTLETGTTINVPMFINEGDVIKIDTRTGVYLGRV